MSDHHAAKPSIGMLFGIWFVLMFLLGVTYWAGVKLDVGEMNFVIAFSIAMVKATLIILIFMHVYYSQPLVRLVAGAGFFFMFIMLLFTFCDFKTREHIPGIGAETTAVMSAAAEEPKPEHEPAPH